MSDFCHLHCHDEYSLLDGFGSPVSYAKKAKELGHACLAITNHGNVDGLVKFQNACKAEGITPIHGCELYVVPDISAKIKGEKRKHLTALVKNKKGWNNLLRMLSKANLEGFYLRPRVDPRTILDNQEGIVFMSACSSTLLHEHWGREMFLSLSDKFLEVMPLDYEMQKVTNNLCIELSKANSIPMVATNDCHYVNKDEELCQEVLLAIQSKKKWNDKDRWKFDVTDLYVKTKAEMLNSFRAQGVLDPRQIRESIANTVMVADMCKDFTIEHLSVDLPKIPGYENRDDGELLIELCEAGMQRKVYPVIKDKDKMEIYRSRLEEELGVIIKQGFARYFLIIWEMIKWCEENDVMVGPGRGSSGGSIVAYLLNITRVDPIKYKLVFARFISPARIDLPDVDMDFEDIKRDKVVKHLKDMYGEYSVCGVSTFLSSKGRGALRDVSRVFDIPLVDVNKASSCIVVRSGGDFRSDYTIEDAFTTFEDGKRFKEKYPEVTSLAMKIEGQTRGKGQHAAAVIISNEDLREGKRASLQVGKNDIITNWDKLDIEHFGLMKLDVLGLSALTVLSLTRKLIKQNHNVDIVYDDIPLDDPKVFKEFNDGNNIGCFQVGSLGLRRFCRQLGIDNFDMLVHATSLYRPGTLRSGMTTEFVLRKSGQKQYKSIHPVLDDITKDTFGIILYQEQVMRFMYDLGGLGWKTADTVRKVISKSQGVEQFMKFKKMFADGCVERKTLDRETAEKLWDELANFGSYGFNLSHAVEYSLISYWDQWCKIYYPAEFICASLTHGSEEKKEDLIEEAIRLGIDVRPPKKDISDSHSWIIHNGTLYCPFVEIKGIGEKTADKVSGKAKDSKKLSKKFVDILSDIHYDVDEPVTNEDADRIGKYFQFSFSRDKYRRIRKVKDRILEHISFEDIKQVDFNVIDKEYKYYFGKMTEIKFGYRAKLDTLEKRLSIAGQADNLGGVYGNFEGETDFCMLVFGSDIYGKKKEQVEHCSDTFLISKANIPSRAGSIMCNDAWFEEDIFSGNLDGIGIDFSEKRRWKNTAIESCDGCKLRSECSKPVLPSTGLWNIMIIGEAPGKDEDRQGEGFVGSAGQLLWKELAKYGLTRRMFNVTNVVKCYPSDSKTPGLREVKACSKWLDEEIQKIRPFLILSFGNTGLKYFKGEETGIMERNGKTEWMDKYDAWVSWCIHPASVLYHQENKKMFDEGIENFVKKIKSLSKIIG